MNRSLVLRKMLMSLFYVIFVLREHAQLRQSRGFSPGVLQEIQPLKVAQRHDEDDSSHQDCELSVQVPLVTEQGAKQRCEHCERTIARLRKHTGWVSNSNTPVIPELVNRGQR